MRYFLMDFDLVLNGETVGKLMESKAGPLVVAAVYLELPLESRKLLYFFAEGLPRDIDLLVAVPISFAMRRGDFR